MRDNHDFIKQCIIYFFLNWAGYTSKYCLLSIQLTSACIYTPISDVLCVHVASSVFFAQPYTIWGGGGLKPPLRNFAITIEFWSYFIVRW